jgi:hypothetical protein
MTMWLQAMMALMLKMWVMMKLMTMTHLWAAYAKKQQSMTMIDSIHLLMMANFVAADDAKVVVVVNAAVAGIGGCAVMIDLMDFDANCKEEVVTHNHFVLINQSYII